MTYSARVPDNIVFFGQDSPEALDYDIGALAERARRLALTHPRSSSRLREAAQWLVDLQSDTMADILMLEEDLPLSDDRDPTMIAAQDRNDARRGWAA